MQFFLCDAQPLGRLPAGFPLGRPDKYEAALLPGGGLLRHVDHRVDNLLNTLYIIVITLLIAPRGRWSPVRVSPR